MTLRECDAELQDILRGNRPEREPGGRGERERRNHRGRGKQSPRNTARHTRCERRRGRGGREGGVCERVAERLRALEAIGGEFFERSRDCRDDVRRHGLPALAHRSRRIGDDAHDDLLCAGPGVRRVSREHFVEHGAERVDVGARGDFFFRRRLLRAHVVRRAERETRLRHPAAGSGAHGERNSKIRDHRVAAMQQDVLRFYIAVHDAVFVRVLKGVEDFSRDAHRLVHAELRLAIQLLAQRLALNERHDVEQKAIRSAAVEQRQDVRMLERRGRRDLLHEPIGAENGRELRLEQLEGDFSFVTEIFAEIDRRHPALTEMALDAVASGECVVQAVGLLGHACLGRRRTVACGDRQQYDFMSLAASIKPGRR